MSASSSCCFPTPRQRRSSRFLSNTATAASLGFALLLPKCPMCVLAWATVLGFGATWQHWLGVALSPRVRPWLLALLALPILLRVAFALRRRTHPVRCTVEERSHA